MGELWMKAKGYEDYLLVSSEGRVRSVARQVIQSNGKVLNYSSKLKKLSKDSGGYLQVGVYDESKSLKKLLSVHRLVAQTFIPNPENKREVNHKDGVKWNNSVNNLEWNTYRENQEHAYNTGLKTRKLTEKDVLFIRKNNYKLPNQYGKLPKGKYSQTELSEMFNVKPSTISDIIKRKVWKHI